MNFIFLLRIILFFCYDKATLRGVGGRNFLKYVNPIDMETIASKIFCGEGNLFKFKILVVYMFQIIKQNY